MSCLHRTAFNLPVACFLVVALAGECLAAVTVGAFDTTGSAEAVTIANGIAYVAEGRSGLRILDVSDAEAPAELGALDTVDATIDVEIVGSIAYLASSELLVVDVSDPTTPAQLGSVELPGLVTALEVVGDRLYLGNSSNRLRVFDISAPEAPVEVGSVPVLDTITGIDVADGIAYVSVRRNFVRQYDVTGAGDPVFFGFLRVAGSSFAHTEDVEVENGLAYVAVSSTFFDPDSVQIFDVTDPSTPLRIGLVELPEDPRDLELQDDFAYVAAGSRGLIVIDVSSPASPQVAGSLDTPHFARDIELADSLVHVADDEAGLRIIDASNLAFPTEIGALDVTDRGVDIEVVAGLAYLADVTGGLRVVDVSEPSAPALVSSVPSIGDTEDVEVEGAVVYLVDGDVGLRIFEASANAVPLGSIAIEGAADVEIVGDLAFLASRSGLVILDVSDPTAPAPVGSLELSGSARAIAVADGVAYVTKPSGLLVIIDVSDPAAPVELSSFSGLRFPLDLEVAGGVLYVADGTGGLKILDVSDPSAPVLAGELPVYFTGASSAIDVTLTEGLLYLAGAGEGVRVVDVSDISAPFELGGLIASGVVIGDFNTRAVAVAEDLVYSVTTSGGLRVSEFGPEYAGAREIDIDILPGKDPNVIFPFSRLPIAVAILGSEILEVSELDGASLAFGPDGAAPLFDLTNPWILHLSRWDVNRDGKLDLLSHYRTEETGIPLGATEACLSAVTVDGERVEGCEAIVTMAGCGLGFELALILPPLIWLRQRRRRAARR